MRPEDQARAIPLLQQLGFSTRGQAKTVQRFAKVGDLAQTEQPLSTPTRAATIRAARVIADVHATVVAAAVARDQQVSDFVSNTGVEAHAAAISACATEEAAAHAS